MSALSGQTLTRVFRRPKTGGSQFRAESLESLLFWAECMRMRMHNFGRCTSLEITRIKNNDFKSMHCARTPYVGIPKRVCTVGPANKRSIRAICDCCDAHCAHW